MIMPLTKLTRISFVSLIFSCLACSSAGAVCLSEAQSNQSSDRFPVVEFLGGNRFQTLTLTKRRSFIVLIPVRPGIGEAWKLTEASSGKLRLLEKTKFVSAGNTLGAMAKQKFVLCVENSEDSRIEFVRSSSHLNQSSDNVLTVVVQIK